MSKSRIIRFLSWFFTILLFVGLGLVYSHCSMQRFDRQINTGSGSSGGSDDGDRNNRNDDDNDNNDDNGGGDNNNNSNSYCQDNPSAEICSSIDDTTSRIEEASEAHKDLRKRYQAWVDLEYTSHRNVEEFLSGLNLNDIDRLRVYFELEEKASGVVNTYGGDIQVLVELDQSGKDAAIKHPAFRSGDRSDNRYNQWSTHYDDHSGLGFRAFFQNQHGALILVVDDVERKTTDESGQRFLGEGSIWFKQFKTLVGSVKGNNAGDCYAGGVYIGKLRESGRVTDGRGVRLPNMPSTKCWLIGTRTPYQCRAPFENLEPTGSCYKKLGDFEKLNINEAFDLDGDEDFLPGN